MANRYWVGGSGSWSDTSHWSATSGGSGGASVPTSSDDVIFDASSGTSDITATLAGDYSIKSINTQSFLNELSLQSSASVVRKLSISGNINTYHISAHGAYPTSIRVTGLSNASINSSIAYVDEGTLLGKPGITIENNATLNLVGTCKVYKISTAGANSVLKTNGYTLDTFYLGPDGTYGSGLRKMDLSNSTTIIRSELYIDTSYTNVKLITDNSTILFRDAYDAINVPSHTFNAVEIWLGVSSTYSQTTNVKGAHTFNSLSIRSANSAANTVNFSDNITANTFYALGPNSTNRLKLVAPSKTITINNSSDGDYVAIDGLSAAGPATPNIGRNSTDNTGTWYIPPPAQPTLTTDAATSITTTTATLGGNVTSDGDKPVTERGVVWSTSTNPTTSDSKKTSSGTTGSYTVNVTGLSPKTTYHYRAYAINSEGTGYGEDKTFTTLGKPTAQFNASPRTGKRPVTVYFTDQSTFAPTSWSWNFGDGGTSTTKNPQHTYSSGGNYTVSLTATNAYGSDTETKTSYITIDIESFSGAINGTLTLGGAVQRPIKQTKGKIEGTLTFGGSLRSITLKDTQSVDTKKYLYKVYDEEGNYIEVWKDVISEPNFTAEINQIGSTMNVELARTSDSLGVTTSNLLTEDDEVVQTEDSLPIQVRTMSRNQIGPGSSVQYNHRVDVYAYYGSVEPLLTEDYEPITTEDGETLLASTGAPNGRRIFTGFISEINTRYGNTDTVQLQLTSYGWDLNQYPITNEDGDTTVSFLSVDPSDIVRDALDKFVTDSSSYYTYTNWESQTIESTGTTVSYTFKANTYADVLDKTLELMPENWYYYVGLGDNLVYFRERSQTAQHRFFLGKHIKSLDLKGSILDVKNRVLFTGGGDPALYIERVEAPAANTRRALELYSDGRVTLQDSAEIISDGIIEKANKVNYRTTIEILSGAYDIESINLGDVVGFRNFGNFVDELLLQIVGISYTPDVVQLQLETKPPTINKRLADIQRNLKVQENQAIPDAPQ